MKNFFFAVLFLAFSFSLSAAVRGVVRDAAGQPVEGATVASGNRSVMTDAGGAFTLELPPGPNTIRVTHPGFASVVRTETAEATLEITLQPAFAETMVVSAIRADADTPVTRSDLARDEIERRYHGQDVPLLMRDTPSINAYAESGGGGSGYSYINLRGISPTRINFTLDGVPLSDSEDMGTYFVDFPDLARSLESIQIQRGVGTSTFGTAAFGGSVNLESVAPADEARTEATLGAGSFGAHQVSVGHHTGDLGAGISLYTRLSYLQNDGYRDNSETRQRNVFVSAAKTLGDDAQLRLTGFSGHEWMQSSYYAVDPDTLAVNRRSNPLRPEEKDSFGYDLAQLQYIRSLGGGANMTASAYYQRGYGWYRLFQSGTDTLRQYGLDGMLFGGMVTYSKTAGSLTTNYGVHVNHFKRDHTRDDLTADRRDYANDGVKGEANAFAKASWGRGPWLLFGDAQLRYSSFDYHGSADVDAIDWTFFNPKIGARYRLSAQSSVYGTAGIATREPTRNDLFLGEDDASVAHDLHAVKPERVVDLELGWDHRAGAVDLAVNLYAMEFRNEIAATGEQSEIGLSLRKNVDDSYRRGIELEAAWQASPQLQLKTNANLSRNRIARWTQFYDVYDAAGNWTESRPITFRNVQPLLTPSLIVSQAVDYSPLARLSFGAVGRWVGRSFLDNTNDENLATPSFFLLDGSVSYAFASRVRVSLQVNNALDSDEIYPSGYSYPYIFDGTVTGTPYYYPQATRNATVLVDLNF
jgi:iron complex outermembrane receptor protein